MKKMLALLCLLLALAGCAGVPPADKDSPPMETLNEVLAMATIVSVLYPNDLTPENLATTQAILSAWQAAAKGDRSQAAKFIASEIVAQATKPTTTEAQKALLTTSADSLAHILVGLLPAGKTP